MIRTNKLFVTAAIVLLLTGLVACGSDTTSAGDEAGTPEAEGVIPASATESEGGLHAFAHELTLSEDDESDPLLLGDRSLPVSDDTETQTL